MKFVCVGHATYDIILPLDEFPKEDQRYKTTKKVECGGGPAATACYLLAKWGMDATFIGIVGNDHYGSKIMKEFNEVGINTDYIEKNNFLSTDVSYIIANGETGSRTIITSKGQKIDKLYEPNTIDDADYILVDGTHIETAKEVINNNPNAITILDAAHVNKETEQLGNMVNYFICSKDYAEAFTNKKIDFNNPNTLAEIYEVLYMNFKTNIIITLGEKGVFTKTDNYKLIPANKVKPVDSTGAGDIFHGAFAYFIANNYSIEDAIVYANKAAAISTERIGSRNAIVDVNEIVGNKNVEHL